MSSKTEKRAEATLQLLDRLAAESAVGTPIIVEGKNDVHALHRLDVNGDIITAKSSGKNFLDVLSEVEQRGKREVILLMDFDRRGREWTKRFVQSFERMKIKPQLYFWDQLLGLIGREVKDIEGLATYIINERKRKEQQSIRKTKLLKIGKEIEF